ncbi:LysR substrate-binding domain-containing protein [Eremococcus coleocola]|uniref:LysR substrate-binding domain-containing protein n=1 Tax=Eremococcus coleocola TaxID=88132 RepID=UPI0009D73A98
MFALHLIEAGFGITICSKFFLDSIPNPARIAIRPFSEHFYRSIMIAQNKDRYNSAVSELFRQFCFEW